MLSPEIEMVIACGRPEGVAEPEIRKLAGRVNNWHMVVNLALSHGMAAFVYQRLKRAAPSSLPPDCLARLKTVYTDHARINLSLATRLLTLLQAFKANGIDAVAFKGPVIAQRAYNDIYLRSFCDLDILIAREDVVKSASLLTREGFIPEFELPPGKLGEKYISHENSLSFYGKHNLSIDLHWEITGRYLLKHLYLEDFQDLLETTSLLGKPIHTIPDSLMLVYLSAHGASHCWDRFEWLCSFSWLVSKQDDAGVLNALKKAAGFGAKRMFLLGLYLANRLLNLPLPEPVLEAIGADPGIEKLAIALQNRMFSAKTYGNKSADWRFSPLHIRIRDSRLDAFKYMVYLLTMPTVKEWSKIPVPVRLTPLYRLMRPVRLASAFVAAKMVERTILHPTFQRIKEMVGKNRDKGQNRFFLYLAYVPARFVEKGVSSIVGWINKLYFNPRINTNRLDRFHASHRSRMKNHFYIIGMPGKIHFLETCLGLIHDKINLFIILNGVKKNERQVLANQYGHIPRFDLKSAFGRPIAHGEVINLLLETNQENFGLIDHDLYIFNPEIFNHLTFEENEYVAGPFALKNEKAGITFPATFFLFIRTAVVKKIMKKYGVGAQIYSRIPHRLIPLLQRMNLGYNNFLKDYLNYFDPFNLIFALAEHEGFRAKILPMGEEDMVHLGGRATEELSNKPDETRNILAEIRSKQTVQQR